MEIKAINLDQKKIIWAIWKTKVKLDDNELYQLMKELFKKEKMSELTFQEADLLIANLRRQTGETVAGKLTRKQRFSIISKQKTLGWGDSELAGFIKKQTTIDSLEWLTINQASKVISGLINYQKWLKKKAKERTGAALSAS